LQSVIRDLIETLDSRITVKARGGGIHLRL
jgi:hypothetical protein